MHGRQLLPLLVQLACVTAAAALLLLLFKQRHHKLTLTTQGLKQTQEDRRRAAGMRWCKLSALQCMVFVTTNVNDAPAQKRAKETTLATTGGLFTPLGNSIPSKHSQTHLVHPRQHVSHVASRVVSVNLNRSRQTTRPSPCERNNEALKQSTVARSSHLL